MNHVCCLVVPQRVGQKSKVSDFQAKVWTSIEKNWCKVSVCENFQQWCCRTFSTLCNVAQTVCGGPWEAHFNILGIKISVSVWFSDTNSCIIVYIRGQQDIHLIDKCT